MSTELEGRGEVSAYKPSLAASDDGKFFESIRAVENAPVVLARK